MWDKIAGLFGAGKTIAEPVEAVGNVLDKLFTSDDERLAHSEIVERLRQQPGLAQVELNKVEAQHRSIFVAGWRPFIGWVCGINIAYLVCIRDIMTWVIMVFNIDIAAPPALGMDMTAELVIALLGISGLRTFEKLNGRAK